MERLTTKIPKPVYYSTLMKCYFKLQELEDIEEELGIDLNTLFKALVQGIYYKDNHNAIIYCDKPKLIGDITYTSYPHEKRIDKNLFGCSFIVNKNGLQISCCHYGEKWSLRKEELEK